jgi:hypothetical protein
MHPLLVVAVPLVLIVVGMVLNSIGLSFDQPPSSPEQDPVKKLTAEKEAYRQFFDRQRSRAIKRQKRTGQYAWLLIFATIGSFIWLYMGTVNSTTLSTHQRQVSRQIAPSRSIGRRREARSNKGNGFLLGARKAPHGFERRR